MDSSGGGDIGEVKSSIDVEAEVSARIESAREAYRADNAIRSDQVNESQYVDVDLNGNAIDSEGRLVVDQINSIDDLTDDDFDNPSRSVELPRLPKAVDEAIGANGKPVVIKKNIFERNIARHNELSGEDSRRIISEALYNPDLYGQNQKVSRPNNWVLIHKAKTNESILLEVNRGKDNVEIVHWHYLDDRGIEKIKRQASREGGQILMLPSASGEVEEAGALSSRTASLSQGKGSENVGDTKSDPSREMTDRGDQVTDPARVVEGRDYKGDEKSGSEQVNEGVVDNVGQGVTEDVPGEQAMLGALEELEGRFGVQITVHRDASSIKEKSVRETIEAGDTVKGWFNTRDRSVHVYLPQANGVSDITSTYLHEVVAHYGMRELIGEEKYNGFLETLWGKLDAEERSNAMKAANMEGMSADELSLADIQLACDEYVASIAERGDFDGKDRATWRKMVDAMLEILGEFLDKLGVSERDAVSIVEDLLSMSARNLERTSDNGKSRTNERGGTEVASDSRVKVREDGSKDYVGAGVEATIDDLFMETGHDTDVVDSAVQAGISEAEAKVKEAEADFEKRKKKVKGVQGVIALANERKATMSQLEGEVKFWQEVWDRLHPKEEDRGAVSEVRVDVNGNAIDEEGRLVVDRIESIDELTDEDFESPTRSVELPKIPANVDSAIGADGKPVVIKKNIFEKNRDRHKFTPEESRAILKKALYDTDLVGQTQPISRPNYWVAIKVDNASPIVVLEVSRNKDNVEIIGWYSLDERNLDRIKRQAGREGGELLILSKDKVESLSTPTTGSLPSESKGSDNVGDVQEEVGAATEVRVDVNGNAIDEEGRLVVDRIESIDELTDEDFENPTRSVELPKIPANVDSAIGADGKPVVIKKNIFEKNRERHKFTPEESRAILKKALYDTDLIGQSQPISKPNYWVAIKVDSESPLVVLEVNRNKDNVEIVGWYSLDDRNLDRIKRQADREGGELLILSKDTVDSLSTPTADSLPSESKGSDNVVDVQEEDALSEDSALSEKGALSEEGDLSDRSDRSDGSDESDGSERKARTGDVKKFKSRKIREGEGIGEYASAIAKENEEASSKENAEALSKENAETSSKENEKSSNEVVSNTDRIEDYGEKFGGAAKDLYKEAMVSFHREVGVDDLKANSLSKVFPRPKLGELVKEGSVSQENACLVEALYNEIGNKPRTRRVVGWAKSAKGTRDLIVEILDNPLKDWSSDVRISKSAYNEAKLLKDLNFPENDVSVKGIKISNYVDTSRGINDYMVTGLNGTYGYTSFKTYEEAVSFVAKKLEEKKQEKSQEKRIKKNGGDRIPERKDFKVGRYGQGDFVVYYYDPYTKSQIQIRRDFKTAEEAFEYVETNIDNLIEKYTNAPNIVLATNPKNKSIAVYISKPKNKSRNVLIKDGFKSWSDAKLWVQENFDDLKGKAKDLEGKLNESWEARERIGADHRQGVDVDAASFVNDFGFRGVEFGNWVNQKERQEALNSAYDGLMDLCELIGISPKALSLNGRLGLAFGSRGRSKAMAHYEPDKKVINLTKMKGSGSLAHEWLHALDNYFSGEELKFASDGRFSDEVRKEMQDAWNRLTDAISKSNMAERSKSLDTWKNKVYWGTRIELTARAFQGWVKDRIERNGGVSDYLNNYFKGGDNFFNEKFYPYPVESEDMNAVYDAFDHLFDTMEERIDDETGNAVLFRRSLNGANSKQKQAGGTKVELDDDVLFRLTKRGKSSVDSWLKKRDDLTNEEREAFMQYLEPMDNNLAMATGWWYAKGVIRVPEDQSKVNDAVEVAKRAKVDPMRYGSPMEVLDTFKEYKIKGEAIDPESVPLLSNGRNVGDVSYGIRVYDVEDSKTGQQAMREVINTHWGEDANPWCLLQGDGEGNLYPDAWQYWNHYNGVSKRVAFKDGKLLAFCANDYDSDCWWDRQDEPHDGIPVDMKMPNDELGREATYDMNEDGTFDNPTNIHKGNKQNGVYEEWLDEKQLWRRINYKNGKRNGLREAWHFNGQLKVRENYKDGKLDGLQEEWYDDGKLKSRDNYKNGELDGLCETWDINGKIRTRENYKDGNFEGLFERWYPNGSLRSRENYKDNTLSGVSEEWYENGQLKSRENYKVDDLDGLREVWYDNGQMLTRSNWVDGELEGLYEKWKEDGKLFKRSIYKDGRVVEDLTDDVRFRRNSEELEGIKKRAVAEGRFMKAPNGEPTKLNEEQWLEVRSRAFKDWFGDWELPHQEVKVVEASSDHDFGNIKEARIWAKENIARVYSNKETGGKGEIRISRSAIDKFLNESSISKSSSLDAHLSTVKVLPTVISNSIIGEKHSDYTKDSDGLRSEQSAINSDVTILRLFGAININGDIYRVKTTLKKDTRESGLPSKAYSYETTKIELIAGNLGKPIENSKDDASNTINSIPATKLLKDVEKSYEKGKYLLDDYSKVVDENGEPMVVYHGTPNKDFFKFDIDSPSLNGRGEGKGFYFIADYDIAKKYAGRYGRVIPAFLNVRRFWSGFDSLSPEEKKTYLSELNDEKAYNKLGIDAFHVGGQLIVRRPNQIKSATDNVGSFSGDSDDIRFRRGKVTEEMDTEYMEAVKSGDMEAAQRLVNEAAKLNGYDVSSEYQGTSAFNGAAPYGNDYFSSKEERKAAFENDEFEGDTTLGDYIDSGIVLS